MARGWSTDFYAVLGVAPTASAADVRRAYLRLAREHHPDRHGRAGAAEQARHDQVMRDVNAAWAVLGDPAARRDYDEMRAAAESRDAPSDDWGREAAGPPTTRRARHGSPSTTVSLIPILASASTRTRTHERRGGSWSRSWSSAASGSWSAGC